jgi:putative transposase
LTVVGVLEWLFLTRGVPKFLRSDNGPEFVARAVCRWLETSGCQTLFITPGSPWENGYIESFFDKLRDECLNREVFRNGRETQAIVENWRQEYNNYRPHSSLDYLTPAEFARRYYENKQAEEATQLGEMAGTLSL